MAKRYLYSGRVQGVGFRWTVCHLAAGFPVTGYVRNLIDGRVEMVVDGDPDAVTSLAAAIEQHFHGNIEGCRNETCNPGEHFDSFQIRR